MSVHKNTLGNDRCCGWMNTFSDGYFFTGILLEKSFDFSEWTPPSRSSPKQSGVREEKDWLSRNSVELRYTVKKCRTRGKVSFSCPSTSGAP